MEVLVFSVQLQRLVLMVSFADYFTEFAVEQVAALAVELQQQDYESLPCAVVLILLLVMELLVQLQLQRHSYCRISQHQGSAYRNEYSMVYTVV